MRNNNPLSDCIFKLHRNTVPPKPAALGGKNFEYLLNYLSAKMTMDQAIQILTKEKRARTYEENLQMAELFSDKMDYFRKIKSEDKLKLFKLISVLSLESYNDDETVIKFGDYGDKFYIMLKGCVSVRIPDYVKKEVTVKEFLTYLRNIKNNERDEDKHERVLKKNDEIRKLDYESLYKLGP
ncbi:MAG: cyclic nucleotide-binding domain-containing protein, partial [archaeon]|nr:cyclic nucleotide-binding domain-containing protein [archaeon]